jgi:xylulokinase
MPESAKCALGIDLGTSSCKVALVEPSGRVVHAETEGYGLYILPGGGAEQDPDEWWKSVLRATRRLMDRGMAKKSEVISLGVTGQFSGTVPVASDGTYLRRAIIWLDTRGEPYVRRISRGLINVAGYDVVKLITWLRKTGGAPAHSGKDSISHILFIKNEEPDTYRSTYKFLEPKDYVNLRLTGKFVGSYDSMILNWVTDNRDCTSVKYDKKLLKMASVDGEKLPELKQSIAKIGTVRNEVAEELGIAQDVSVIAGAGDMQSALIGSGCTLDNQTNLYFGTSSWLTAHVPMKKTDISHNIASLPSAIPGKYFVAAEQESAGKALDFVRRVLFSSHEGKEAKVPNFKEMDDMAALVPPGSDGIIFTPWLYGERAPVEDRFLRGGFANLSLSCNANSMIRSVLEGVAFNSRWLLEPVEGFIGRDAEPIFFAGGGAASELWSQIVADVMNRTVLAVRDPVSVCARGAALLSMVSVGLTDFVQISRNVPVEKKLTPNKENVKIYDTMFRNFVEFYHKNRKLYSNMNRLPQ